MSQDNPRDAKKPDSMEACDGTRTTFTRQKFGGIGDDRKALQDSSECALVNIKFHQFEKKVFNLVYIFFYFFICSFRVYEPLTVPRFMGRCLCTRVRFDIDSDELICIRLRVISIRNRGGVELVVFFVVHVPSRKFYIGVSILYHSSPVLVWDIAVLLWDITVLRWDITVRLRFVMDVGFVKWRVFVLGLTFTYNIIMITLWFRLHLRRFFDFLTEFVNGSTKNQKSKEGQNYAKKKIQKTK